MADSLTGLGTVTTIFRTEPDWSNQVEFERELNAIRNGYPGTIQEILSWTQDLPHMFNFKLQNLLKVEEYGLIEFFNARQGRLKPFWVPSHLKEFELSETMPNGATALYVYDNGFANAYRGYERVFLDLVSGDLITRQVMSVASGPGDDELSLHLDTALDREIAPEDVLKFGKLLFVRFAKDILELSHDSKSISSAQVSFQELVKEYPA